MTHRLYYENPYAKELSGVRIVSCAPRRDGYGIMLDQTIFYPEGGGQMGDTGSIAVSAGETERAVHVLDTVEEGGHVVHITDGALPAGETCRIRLDWPRRHALMQQHTGEHIVSGLVKNRFGLDNVGFHMGRDCVTVDYGGPLTREQLDDIELAANEAVYANIPVRIATQDPGGDYRAKLDFEGAVRVVDIPGCDRCACCGLHVKATGEVGIIKILSVKNYKGGVRVGMLSGKDALQDYRRKHEILSSLAAQASTSVEEYPAYVEKLLKEKAQLARCASDLARRMLETTIGQMEPSDKPQILFVQDADGVLLSQSALALLEKAPVAAVFCGEEPGGYRYAVASKSDARIIAKTMNEALRGRGGGSAALAQGQVSAGRQAIEAFFRALSEPAQTP
ncbi:MAG: alanyl-tRNA editing protein [Christensenellales bacterium]|jgi:alanyl-tRNA synthetase